MEWVHDLEFGLFVGQWEIVDGAGKLNGKRDHFKPFIDVRERGTRVRRMPTDATRERVTLQGRFPATAEVKEVMTGKFVCFIFLRRLFTNLLLHPPHRKRPERGAVPGIVAV